LYQIKKKKKKKIKKKKIKKKKKKKKKVKKVLIITKYPKEKLNFKNFIILIILKIRNETSKQTNKLKTKN